MTDILLQTFDFSALFILKFIKKRNKKRNRAREIKRFIFLLDSLPDELKMRELGRLEEVVVAVRFLNK